MPETDIAGATAAPKRRSRKAPGDAPSATKRTSRGKRGGAAQPDDAVPAAPRSASKRTRRQQTTTEPRAAAAPPESDGISHLAPPAGECAAGTGAEVLPQPDPAAADCSSDTSPVEDYPPDAAPTTDERAVTTHPEEAGDRAVALPDTPDQGGGAARHHAGGPCSAAPPSTDPAPPDAPHRVGRTRPARPTFKQTVLRAAEERFQGDRVREPVTSEQVDELLVLLHEPEQSRSLVDATYDFLRRGMSKRHAGVQIEKLRGTFVPRDARSAA